jgi:hypothetical protein
MAGDSQNAKKTVPNHAAACQQHTSAASNLTVAAVIRRRAMSIASGRRR